MMSAISGKGHSSCSNELLNIYLNQSDFNYFHNKYSIILSLKSIINQFEENQHSYHMSSYELEAVISHEVQQLYNAIVDSLDFNLLL